MMEAQVLVFDLDGTLVDSRDVIVKALNHARERSGLDPMDAEQILPYLGVDSMHLISNIFGTGDRSVIESGMHDFRSYWDKNLASQSRLFEGVTETLEHYKKKKLLVLSNGITEVINKMLDGFGLRKYFSGIFSGDEPDCVKPSACPIEKAIEEGHIRQKSKAVMIGDMAIDIEAGKKAGIRTCAVTYGIGRLEDIKKSGPDFIISDIRQLKDHIG
jgi:phosphoglycolate phosphatase